MRSMENIDVRIVVYNSGITYRTIAKEIGITPEHLSHLMRYPLSKKDRERILKAVGAIGLRELRGAET